MKKEICWILALGLTIYLSILQLVMSSRFPLDTKINTGKQEIPIRLISSFTGETDCPIILPIEDITVSGYILYHLKNDSTHILKMDFKREGDKLICYLPKQAPSTQILYQIFLERDKNPIAVNNGKPIELNFRGKVPFTLLLLDGLLTIFVILISNLTGFFGLLGVKSYKWFIYLTVFSLMFLGFFVHPLLQKYSLSLLWPKYWNFNSKILLVLIIWSVALILSIRINYRLWPVLAAAGAVAIFLIPHQDPHESVHLTLKIVERNFIALLQLF